MTALPAREIVSAGPCRFCGAPLTESVVDLGFAPSANAYLREEDLAGEEPTFPLQAYVCSACRLVQLREFHSPQELFGEESLVIEVASNDGYLLRAFRDRGIPVLGIEPAANVAEAAEEKGIPTMVRFFGTELAMELSSSERRADLLVANNVLAHVPDLNDFVRGLKIVLAPQGVLTIEFPHLLRLLAENQFDTIYHEHFSYFSLLTVERVLARHSLSVFDVEALPSHGGSLRIFATHAEMPRLVANRVFALRAQELKAGLDRPEAYRRFADAVAETRDKLRQFFETARREGKSVVGYGAPAKGNTLLNYCGIGTDDLAYTVDRSPHKQGTYLPGTHIPVRHPNKIRKTKPDYVLILPWNLKDEIAPQLRFIRDWGGKLVLPIPEVRVIE